MSKKSANMMHLFCGLTKNTALERILLVSLLATYSAVVFCQADFNQPQNCWSYVDENSWKRILTFESKTSQIFIHLNKTGPRVLTCLQAQTLNLSSAYETSLIRTRQNESRVLETKVVGVNEWLRGQVVNFDYILLQGSYGVKFRLCHGDHDLQPGCESETVTSFTIPVTNSHDGISDSWCLQTDQRKQVEQFNPILVGNNVNFSFAFIPCHKVLPYEMADVSVFKADTNESVCNKGLEIIKTTVEILSAHVFREPLDQNYANNEAVITYQTPKLEGNRYYCIQVISKHPFCKSLKPAPFLSDPGLTRSELPEFCNFTSATVFVSSLPFITEWIPFCTSHFQCGWLYITIVGSAAFILSFMLALICNCCCCRRRRRPKSNELPISPSNLDTLKLTDIKPKRTWSDVHEDFYREPPANPGKILLLYSPDSRPFKELQVAFRSFLELACHCVVLDLFDEELLAAIAYDPEAWIDQLLRDDRFKVIVVCSQGAYKRHQAILNGEVLNIPNTDSLDGLFSSGLRFLQDRQYNKNRLALSRYETLQLCSTDFRFDDLGSDREFLVPTQLQELFCWIHDYDPVDLLGKPWLRYHLELQLLQDALKVARIADRKN